MPDAAFFDSAWQAFDPRKPVPADDPEDWYEDLWPARGDDTFLRRWVRRLTRPADRPQRILLMGHAGSGKSTELFRLQREVQNAGFRCARVDVDRDLDREDMEITEVQVLLVERVGQLLRDHDLNLPQDLLVKLHEWFLEEQTVETRSTRSSGALSVEALGKHVFGGLLPTLIADLEVSAERRRILRHKVERRLREFVSLVTEVVAKANELLQLDDFKGLMVFVDGLEKVARGEDGAPRAARILLDHAEQWSRLPVPLVFTAPLALLVQTVRLENHYDENIVVPALPVQPRPDPDRSAGAPPPPYVVAARKRMRDLVNRRASVEDLFEDPSDLDLLVQKSGGSVRDLFRLLRSALDDTDPGRPIVRDAVQGACRRQRVQLSLMLQAADRDRLSSLVEQPETGLHYDEAGVGLLQRELVLPYLNGGRWFGVHPALHDTLNG